MIKLTVALSALSSVTSTKLRRRLPTGSANSAETPIGVFKFTKVNKTDDAQKRDGTLLWVPNPDNPQEMDTVIRYYGKEHWYSKELKKEQRINLVKACCVFDDGNKMYLVESKLYKLIIDKQNIDTKPHDVRKFIKERCGYESKFAIIGDSKHNFYVTRSKEDARKGYEKQRLIIRKVNNNNLEVEEISVALDDNASQSKRQVTLGNQELKMDSSKQAEQFIKEWSEMQTEIWKKEREAKSWNFIRKYFQSRRQREFFAQKINERTEFKISELNVAVLTLGMKKCSKNSLGLARELCEMWEQERQEKDLRFSEVLQSDGLVIIPRSWKIAIGKECYVQYWNGKLGKSVEMDTKDPKFVQDPFFLEKLEKYFRENHNAEWYTEENLDGTSSNFRFSPVLDESHVRQAARLIAAKCITKTEHGAYTWSGRGLEAHLRGQDARFSRWHGKFTVKYGEAKEIEIALKTPESELSRRHKPLRERIETEVPAIKREMEMEEAAKIKREEKAKMEQELREKVKPTEKNKPQSEEAKHPESSDSEEDLLEHTDDPEVVESLARTVFRGKFDMWPEMNLSDLKTRIKKSCGIAKRNAVIRKETILSKIQRTTNVQHIRRIKQILKPILKIKLDETDGMMNVYQYRESLRKQVCEKLIDSKFLKDAYKILSSLDYRSPVAERLAQGMA